MTLNLEQIPQQVSDALERKAAQEGKSVPEVALEAMAKGLGVASPAARKRDLSRYAGKWIEDPAVDEALRQFEQVEEDRP
jgi:hypothetical protein